jgi:hypothetical protein
MPLLPVPEQGKQIDDHASAEQDYRKVDDQRMPVGHGRIGCAKEDIQPPPGAGAAFPYEYLTYEHAVKESIEERQLRW